MIVLRTTDPSAISSLGRHIYHTDRSQFASFEDAANAIVNTLYEEICTLDGAPLFSLLRIFRYGTLNDLPLSLSTQADPNIRHWITLMATVGVESRWCSRHTSRGHQVIPADSPATPMLSAAFRQIGMEFGEDGNINVKNYGGVTRFFHVEDVFNNPYVPDQQGFVLPYGICSAVGIGSGFVNQSAYFMIGFSRETITAEEAEKFALLNPFTATFLASYNEMRLWSS